MPIEMKTNDKLRGAAFHEAGHVIVAKEFGLPVGEIAIGIDGDDAKGRTDGSPSPAGHRSDRAVRCRGRGAIGV